MSKQTLRGDRRDAPVVVRLLGRSAILQVSVSQLQRGIDVREAQAARASQKRQCRADETGTGNERLTRRGFSC